MVGLFVLYLRCAVVCTPNLNDQQSQ